MATRFNDQKASVEQVDPTSATPDHMPRGNGLSSAGEWAPTAQELLYAWDLDILRQGFIRPGLKPLSANELESLLIKFPDVLPQVYVRPNVILLGTDAKEGYGCDEIWIVVPETGLSSDWKLGRVVQARIEKASLFAQKVRRLVWCAQLLLAGSFIVARIEFLEWRPENRCITRALLVSAATRMRVMLFKNGVPTNRLGCG